MLPNPSLENLRASGPLFLLNFLSAVLMEKKDGSPENSSPEQDRRRERPTPLASTGGSGKESFHSSNAPGSREIRPPTRPTAEAMRSSLPIAMIPPSHPPPTKVIPVADRPVNKGKGVVMEPVSGRSPPNVVRWPQEWTGKKRDREFYSDGMSSSWNTTGLKMKRKGQLTDTPKRQPCCATCGKYFDSWKALFGHLRSHPNRDYRGAFPPPKVSDGEPPADNTRTGMIRGIDPRRQEDIARSLCNAATAVSSRLNHSDGGREKPKKIGDTSRSSTSLSAPERPPLSSGRASPVNTRNPEENRRSLRKDGLNLDLNAPAPEPDSDEEDNK